MQQASDQGRFAMIDMTHDDDAHEAAGDEAAGETEETAMFMAVVFAEFGLQR